MTRIVAAIATMLGAAILAFAIVRWVDDHRRPLIVVESVAMVDGSPIASTPVQLVPVTPVVSSTEPIKATAAPDPAAIVPESTATVPAIINLNLADAAMLETLPGIGPVTAAAIIEYRNKNGPFTAVDELLNVSGIGPATLEKIRDSVTVGP